VDLKDLTEAEWRRLKKAAGIKSAGFFKKHDAAVGKYVAKFQKARAKWKANKGVSNLLELNSALTDLKKAFNDFLAKKEFKTDLAQDLQKDLNAWKKEIDDKQIKLATKYEKEKDKLANADVEFVDETVKKWGLGGILD
jgi:hypothetical protein